ncbi:ORF6N domain-containing protein [bacterium]|nr:ORF6N domain-containing protein [bacterium]
MTSLILQERIEKKIFLIREKKVMLGQDIAKLYEVEPRVLIQAVKRNKERFPKDFMFQLTRQELTNLKSQFVISSWGGMRTPPYAFTEQGVAMLSSVLNSKRAIQVNIQIMRTFTKLREILATHKDLQRKIETLEGKYKQHDQQFKIVFEAIRQLLEPPPVPEKSNRKIGFIGEWEKKK